ncbi:hypothetical protein F4782DRAFT_496185 [Xylaria castorea]|nr:hypothetical protein F4782DRAFT_496185 [Xylaria castorea]
MAPDVDRLLLGRLPMPPCEGPKIKAFRGFREEIEFLRLLSCDPESEESYEGDGYVFDVRIGKDRFALKIFKFYDIVDARYGITGLLRQNLSDETLTFHSDPFFAECRAYGRINQYYEGLRDKTRRGPRGSRPRRSRPGPRDVQIRQLAVPCYGYMTLAAEYEKMLGDKFGVWDWNRLEREDSRQITKTPFRCLVKQLIPSQVSILNPRRMLGDLKQLRKIGILTRDIYARNYKAGLLVDFSVAWTKPHWCWEGLGPYQRECEEKSELCLFDAMIKSEEIKTTVRATRNGEYCQKLRSYDIPDCSEASTEWALRLI